MGNRVSELERKSSKKSRWESITEKNKSDMAVLQGDNKQPCEEQKRLLRQAGV